MEGTFSCLIRFSFIESVAFKKAGAQLIVCYVMTSLEALIFSTKNSVLYGLPILVLDSKARVAPVVYITSSPNAVQHGNPTQECDKSFAEYRWSRRYTEVSWRANIEVLDRH